MYKLITAPQSEPISLIEAKAHLRVTSSEEDSLINNLITAVRQKAENFLNRALIDQVWDYYIDEFPEDEIEVKKAPMSAVTYIKYYDADGVIQTWDATKYNLDFYTEPIRIEPAYNETFPGTRLMNNAVVVRATYGYGEAGDVPDAIKSGMYLYLSYLYDNRGDSTTSGVPHVVKDLWNEYRLQWL